MATCEYFYELLILMSHTIFPDTKGKGNSSWKIVWRTDITTAFYY